jgi:prepilin-type N-terminal cleavage/methylation domain-containing protein
MTKVTAMRQRRGFTLIEMLVATALTLFLMAVVSQCFVTALDTFSNLKGIGDLESGLRTATMDLRFDLTQDHFEAKRRLSDTNIGNYREGFFVIYQGSASTLEGNDNDTGLPSLTATNHVLHFAVKQRGNRLENFFSAAVPSGSPLLTQPVSYFSQSLDAFYTPSSNVIFNSPWAEVAYFLYPTGTTTSPYDPTSTSGTQLYGLFRCQLVVVPRTDQVNNLAATNGQLYGGSYLNVACTDNGNPATPTTFNNPIQFFSPNDLAGGTRTLTPANLANPTVAFNRGSLSIASLSGLSNIGATQVLSNVLSFNVRVFTSSSLSTSTSSASLQTGDVDLSTTFPATWDSSSATTPISAIQISIRVWDQKTQQTRQITMIQDM